MYNLVTMLVNNNNDKKNIPHRVDPVLNTEWFLYYYNVT